MIIKHLNKVIDVTKLNSYIDNLEFKTFISCDITFSIANLNNIKFMSFGLVHYHRDRYHKHGKYVYHLVIRNSGILISDNIKNCNNSKIQYPGSIIGIDFTCLHGAIFDHRIGVESPNMITVPLIFNYQLSKLQLITEFTSL